MTVLPIIKEGNPLLRSVSRPFDWAEDGDPVQLAKDLADTMLSKNGIGLSAVQIGKTLRVLAIKTNPILVMFNPIVVDFAPNMAKLEEGCLSFPGLLVKVERPTEVRVRYSLPNREVETKRFDGITARVVQHEMDHLNGVLFFDRATRFHYDQARNRQRIWLRRNKAA